MNNQPIKGKPPKKVKPESYKLKCPRCKTKYKKEKNKKHKHKFEEIHPSNYWGTGFTIPLVCTVCGRRLDYKKHKDKKDKKDKDKNI